MSERRLLVADTDDSYFVAVIPPAHPQRLSKEHIGFEKWLYGWPLGQLVVNRPDQQVFGFDKYDLNRSLAVYNENDSASKRKAPAPSLPFSIVLARLAVIVEGQPYGEVTPIQNDDDLQAMITGQL